MGTCSVEGVSINSKFILQTGTKWLLRTGGLYQFNSGGRAMGMLGCTAGQIITIVGTGNPNPSTNATLKSQDGNTYVYTVNADGDVKFTPARYLYFTSITVENPSASAVNYTVKYVDEGGTEVKTSTQGEGEVGAGITLTSAEKASFKNDGETKKYIYKSDDSEGKTIASDGSTVVTITFREAATWGYTVNAMNGETKIEELAAGSAFELDDISVPFHKYYNIDGVLYSKDAISNSYVQKVTIDADSKVEGFAYTKSDKIDVVFFKEAEDIATLTQTSGKGTEARCSFAQGGYADADAVITTLTPGKYVLTGAGYGGNLVFKAGDSEVLNMEEVGYWRETSSAEFVVAENTDITFKGGASGGNASLDYVIITKIPESVSATITSAGYATYCSPYALDFSEVSGLKAYIITGTESGNTLALSAVTKVPANTGVLLQGEVDNYDIPVIASADPVEGNKLVGVTSNTSIKAEAGYVLMDETEGVGFYKNNKAFTVGANTAYLPANFAGGAAREAYFFEGLTGIEKVENGEVKSSLPVKRIVNGNLVIEKGGQMFNAAGAKLF